MSEDYYRKWQAASPFEQVVQHQDAIIALYDVDEGVSPVNERLRSEGTKNEVVIEVADPREFAE
jgi:hypothetical protein